MSSIFPSRSGLLRRRDFLALSTVATGAALLPGLAQAADLAVTTEPLSVGYLEGSDRLENVFQLPWRDVPVFDREDQLIVPASSLPSGDSSLAYSVIKVKVHGLYPAMPPRKMAMPASVFLTIFCDYPWLFEKPLPFYPWGASFGSRPTAGSPTRFTVPTRQDGSLAMAFDIIPSARKGELPRRAVTDFTVDNWADRPKLQRGIYFLGISSSTFRRDQVIPADPDITPWELCSLVLSVEKIEEGAI